jgi:hypothetical protein
MLLNYSETTDGPLQGKISGREIFELVDLSLLFVSFIFNKADVSLLFD